MSVQELREAYERLTQTVCVEELFGMPGPDETPEAVATAVRGAYHRLSRIVHPDLHAGDPDALELANDAFARLGELYRRAEIKIAAGHYGAGSADDEPTETGDGIDLVIRTRRRRYHLRSVLAEGDVATIYGGTCLDAESDDPGIVAKVATEAGDNDLIQREANALHQLWSSPGIQTKHLPVVLDQFKTTDGRLGNVLRRLHALDGPSIRARRPGGLPADHVVWIFERLLSAVGYAHSRGILHGNVEPSHVLVRTGDHNVFLIDWCWAVVEPARTGDGFHCANDDYHPPEVQQRGPPTPAADLYGVGKCMVYLLGGDPAAQTFPASVDERLQRFIRFFLLPSPRQRAQDAWEMHGQLRQLRQEIFGPPRFVELVI
ncbi:MAG: hypothetical protein HY815_15060 [Candidatus Riflebacteria bacterium]|nr:hypothetical protein [Candidatus Riflebacteria bacterium]